MLKLLPHIKHCLIPTNHILIAILSKHLSHLSRHLALIPHIPWERKRTTAKMPNKLEISYFLVFI